MVSASRPHPVWRPPDTLRRRPPLTCAAAAVVLRAPGVPALHAVSLPLSQVSMRAIVFAVVIGTARAWSLPAEEDVSDVEHRMLGLTNTYTYHKVCTSGCDWGCDGCNWAFGNSCDESCDEACDDSCTFFFPPPPSPSPPPPPPPSPPNSPPPCSCPVTGTYAELCYASCPTGTSCTCPACRTCPAGQVRSSCEGYSSGTCSVCPEGTYKEGDAYWHIGCSACTQCLECLERFDGQRDARTGCGGGQRGSCVRLSFGTPTCAGLTASSCT